MEYKVGDKVRILHRDKDDRCYPFTFVDDMAEMEGKVFTISDIIKVDDERCSINGDYHKYYFEEVGYNWHSSMFEKAEDSVAVKTDIPIIKIQSKTKIKIVL